MRFAAFFCIRFCFAENCIRVRTINIQSFRGIPADFRDSEKALCQCTEVGKAEVILTDIATGGGDIIQHFGPAQAFRFSIGSVAEGDTGHGDIFQIELQHTGKHQIPIRCGYHNVIGRSKLFCKIKLRIRKISVL